MLQIRGLGTTYLAVKEKQKLAPSAPDRVWTRAEDYISAKALTRRLRRARRDALRTEPERPRLLLSTLPFLALIALLAVLAIAIMIVAFPGNQPIPKPKPPAQKELGVAERGWFEEAKKEMHR